MSSVEAKIFGRNECLEWLAALQKMWSALDGSFGPEATTLPLPPAVWPAAPPHARLALSVDDSAHARCHKRHEFGLHELKFVPYIQANEPLSLEV
ncbi:hypothetical protein [Tritonibacter horizontis]|uniref:hypothetical protein n=1 Tax=Tritonibacter horizontis TaxID=1768241 RepID=UPI0013F4D8A7|nr:hypothetical protein [Tritonibacter horizontis]